MSKLRILLVCPECGEPYKPYFDFEDTDKEMIGTLIFKCSKCGREEVVTRLKWQKVFKR